MRSITTAALAVALLGLAGWSGAQAASFDLFNSDCLATHADRKAALALADDAGWLTIDPSMVPMPSQQGFKLTDYAVRVKIDGQNFQALLVGAGEAAVDPAQPAHPADICIVMVKPGESAGASQAAAWAAVPALVAQAKTNASLYVFEETAGGHKAVASADAGKAILAAGRLSMIVAAQRGEDLSVLGYIRLKP